MSVKYLFDVIESLGQREKIKNNKNAPVPECHCSVYLTVMCVLNEELYDLFNNNEIQLKYTKNGQLDMASSHGMLGQSPRWFIAKLTNLDEFNDCISSVTSNSKRNKDDHLHTIYQLVIKKKFANEEQSALLTFVDLNRSEKHKESEDISLVNLGTVIGALSMDILMTSLTL